MKVAITGKGGAGKTTVAAIMATTLARSGQRVVAVDGDPSPNLGIPLGVGLDATSRLDSVINAQLRRQSPHQHTHRPGDPLERSAEDVLDELGVTTPYGVRLIQAGRIERPADGCLCCGSHVTARRIFSELSAEDRLVIGDLEPGVNGLIWTEPGPDDAVIVLTGPYRKSLEVSRRAVQVARDLEVGRIVVAANRIEDADDVAEVRRALPGIELVEIPEDDAVAEAAAQGRSVFESAPDAAAIAAVGALTSCLLA